MVWKTGPALRTALGTTVRRTTPDGLGVDWRYRIPELLNTNGGGKLLRGAAEELPLLLTLVLGLGPV